MLLSFLKSPTVHSQLKSVWAYNHQQLKVHTFPRIFDYEVTNACNLNCVFCARERIKERGIGYMKIEEFYHIIDQCPRHILTPTQLFMHGEPTLHPQLAEFIRIVTRRNGTTCVTTNGLLMTKEKSRELLDAGLHFVFFSFEGVTKEVYENLRVGSDFEKVQRNIRDFAEVRNNGGYPCLLRTGLLDCPLTHDYIPEYVEKWGKVVDEVLVQKIHDWGGVVDSPQVGNSDETEEDQVCFYPWLGFSIYWNGDVAPCCLYEADAKLGNVHEQSIKEIWNSPEYQDFRWRLLYDKKSLPICRDCHVHAMKSSQFRDMKHPDWKFPVNRTFLNLLQNYMEKYHLYRARQKRLAHLNHN